VVEQVVDLMLLADLLLVLDTTELLALLTRVVVVVVDLVEHLKVTVLLVDQALLLFAIIQIQQLLE
jgi:hypothetical protein